MIRPEYLLKKHKFLNLAPNNPTQTRYERFQKKATSPLRSQFTDMQGRMAMAMDSALETKYSPFLKLEI